MLRRSSPARARAAAVLAACSVAATSFAGAGVGNAQTPDEPAGFQAQAVAAPVLKWQRELPNIVRESSPKLGDVDGDGKADIVVGSHDGKVYGLHASNGADLPGWPAATGEPIDSSAAIADLDRDGRNEVYIGSGTHFARKGGLNAFRHDGSRRWQYLAADRVFPRPSIHSAPAIGDITGNKVPEISFGSLGLESVHSVDRNGARLRGFPFYADDTIFSSPALVDVTGDGVNEIIIGGDSMIGGPVDHQGGMVRAIRGNGTMVWEYRVNDIVRGGPSVGDIDGDGRLDIVFGGGDFYGGTDSVKVYALDLQGRRKPGWPQTTNGVTNASPTLADISGNGVLDVVIGTFNSMHGRGPGGSIYAWNGAGARINGYPRTLTGGSMLGQVTTADLNGDGKQDLIAPAGGGVWVHDGATGNRMFSLGEGFSTTFQNSALVADVDGNGRLDIIIAGARTNGRGLVLRYEMPSTTAKTGRLGWHQFRRDALNTGTHLSLATARSTTSSCPAGQVPASRFTDVAGTNVHRAAIDCIVWWDISYGVNGRYKPTDTVSRDQMAAFIARLIQRSGGTLPANPPDAFSDDDGNVHEASINKLAAVGIVLGRTEGSYAPGRKVTREQMATFLMRAYTHRTGKTPATSINFFGDAWSSPHRDNINRAASTGVAGGSGGSYHPVRNVPRDQMASFLARLLDLIVVDTGAATP